MTLFQCIFLELVSIINFLGTLSQSFRADERLPGGGRTCAALSYPSCPSQGQGLLFILGRLAQLPLRYENKTNCSARLLDQFIYFVVQIQVPEVLWIDWDRE